MTGPRRELLVFAFDPPTPPLEGHLIGVLERITAGEAIRVVEVLMVTRDDAEGEVSALHMEPGRGSGLVRVATDFRLDARRRRAITEKTLGAEGQDGPLAELAAGLAPGAGVAAVIVEHAWHTSLLEGAERAGAHLVAQEPAGDVTVAEAVLAVTRQV